MIKKFTLLQLFSIVDGRLSTSMDDVYDILNHLTNDSLMTHHLPIASDYVKIKSPNWFKYAREKIEDVKDRAGDKATFETIIGVLTDSFNEDINVPQLKDEFDTSDFEQHMIGNSLFIKKLTT